MGSSSRSRTEPRASARSRAGPRPWTNSRHALVWLVSAFGAVAVARYEAHTHPPVAAPVAVEVARPSQERRARQAEALRDGQQIDVNEATAAELELLPGVGPSLAKRLLATRMQRGRFRTAADLLEVKGVGQKTLSKLTPFLKFDSKHLENTTESNLTIRETNDGAALPEHAGAHVEPDGKGAGGQEIGAEQQVARGPQAEP